MWSIFRSYVRTQKSTVNFSIKIPWKLLVIALSLLNRVILSPFSIGGTQFPLLAPFSSCSSDNLLNTHVSVDITAEMAPDFIPLFPCFAFFRAAAAFIFAVQMVPYTNGSELRSFPSIRQNDHGASRQNKREFVGYVSMSERR